MLIKSYANFIIESGIPAESDILKWTTEAEGGDIDAFIKLSDIIRNSSPKNFIDVRKINLAYNGYEQCKILFENYG